MQALKLHVTVDDAVVRVLPALSALLGHRVELIALQEETARPGQGVPPPRTPQAGALAGKITLKSSRASTTIVGRVTDISFDAPSFRVQTRSKHIAVRAHAHQRKEIQDAWGEEVVVDIDACIDADGNISDATALRIHAVPADLLANFEQSHGSGADAWSSPEGQTFLRSMRGGAGM